MSLTPNHDCWLAAERLCRDAGTTLAAVRETASCKYPHVVRTRWAVIAGLRDKGFSYPAIAHSLGLKDHANAIRRGRRVDTGKKKVPIVRA